MKNIWLLLVIATTSFSSFGMESKTITQTNPITDIGEYSLGTQHGFYRKTGIRKKNSMQHVVEIHINEKIAHGILTRDKTGDYKIIKTTNLELSHHPSIFLEEYPDYHQFITPFQRDQIEQYLGKKIKWASEPAENYTA